MWNTQELLKKKKFDGKVPVTEFKKQVVEHYF